MSKVRTIKFTAVAVKWFDRINGNTYHSVRITRHKDDAVLACPFTYGYDSAYEQTALEAMAKAKWLPVKYRTEQKWCYQRENNYPILFVVSDGLKRECIANGTE